MSKGLEIDLTKPIMDFKGGQVYDNDIQSLKFMESQLNEVIKELSSNPEEMNKRLNEKLQEKVLGAPLTVGYVIQSVCGRGDKDMTGKEKFDLFSIGMRCEGKKANLTDKERTQIMELVNKIYSSPIICGRMEQALESSEVIKE